MENVEYFVIVDESGMIHRDVLARLQAFVKQQGREITAHLAVGGVVLIFYKRTSTAGR